MTKASRIIEKLERLKSKAQEVWKEAKRGQTVPGISRFYYEGRMAGIKEALDMILDDLHKLGEEEEVEKKTYKFYIENPGEEAAGIHSYSERVEVSVDSGDPGGYPGEFQDYMKNSLAEWYDGATVVLYDDWDEFRKAMYKTEGDE